MEDLTGATVGSRFQQGQRLGEYEILYEAGVGGMGIVYKAHQPSLQRFVALKVIREEIARQPEYRGRFIREARLAASVDDDHIVDVYEVGEDNGHLYLAMQWIDGSDLRQVIDRTGRLTPDRAVEIAASLARALDEVHRTAGLVHRDIKPANVMLRRGDDRAFLTDFGVAKPPEGSETKLTQTGWMVGTSGYLSPEQIKGHEPDPRSDLYALGCVFFEALTGRPPFTAENEMALRWAHANDARPLASVAVPAQGDRFDHFFAVALAIDPNQRFRSGREFATALLAAHKGQNLATITAPVPAAHQPSPLPPPGYEPTAVGPQTPPTPVAQPPGPYPVYGYVTPVPAPTEPSRSGNSLALLILGLVAIAGIAAGALAATGVFTHAKTETVVTSVTQASASVASHTTVPPPLLRRPAAKTTTAPHTAPVAPPSSGGGATGTSSCGGDLTVGPDTSCSFARNVEVAYDQSAGGEETITAFSPATGVTYTIECTGGSPHVCTGGTTHGASIYFTSGPTAAAPPASQVPTSPAPGSTSGLHACDQNISANGATSCPFAENVFVAYAGDYKANGVQSDDVVTASSPVTGKSYEMNCTTDEVTVNCSGSTDNFVTFPLHAVEVY